MGVEAVKEFPPNLNEDGSRRRGPRMKEGENWKTGSSQTVELQDEYIQWLVTPKSERVPRTKQELAKLLGVVPRTLGYWDHEPRVQKKVSGLLKGTRKVQNAADILDALFVTATDAGNGRQVAAAKVYLDYVNDAVDELTAEDLGELTNEELAELLADVHDLVVERDE